MRVNKEHFFEGGYYHLFNHSAKGQLLFRCQADYEYCQKLLTQHLSQELFSVYAWCLMPNHFHFLIQQLTEMPVSEPFFHIWNKYTKYYNRTYEEFGSVFCHKLQHIVVKSQEHLQALIAYIHLNPVMAGIVSDPGAWKWSDYLSWIGEKESGLFKPELRNSWYNEPDNYRRQVLEISSDNLSPELLMDNQVRY